MQPRRVDAECPECEAQNDGDDQRCSSVGAALTEAENIIANVAVRVEIFMLVICQRLVDLG